MENVEMGMSPIKCAPMMIDYFVAEVDEKSPGRKALISKRSNIAFTYAKLLVRR